MHRALTTYFQSLPQHFLVRLKRSAKWTLLTLRRKYLFPTLLLLGTVSPPWASEIVGELSTAISNVEVVELIDQGHNAIDINPSLIVNELLHFFASDQN